MYHVVEEKIHEVFKLRQDRAEHSLLYAIDMLESNFKNATSVLQHTQHVPTLLFREFFPKKKKDMPENLHRLVKTFDTPEDPTLLLKRSSMKRGTEATVALAMSHGEDVDWAKVSSFHAQGAAVMKHFFCRSEEILIEPCLADPAHADAIGRCSFLECSSCDGPCTC
jgi:hypothetical protein